MQKKDKGRKEVEKILPRNYEHFLFSLNPIQSYKKQFDIRLRAMLSRLHVVVTFLLSIST